MKTSDLKETNMYKVQLSYAYLYEQINALDGIVEFPRAVCGKDFTDAQTRTLIRRIERAKANAINLKNEIESIRSASGVAK